MEMFLKKEIWCVSTKNASVCVLKTLIMYRFLLCLIVLPWGVLTASDCESGVQNCLECILRGPRCAWDPTSSISSRFRCLYQEDNYISPDLFFPTSRTEWKQRNRQVALALRLGDSVNVSFEVKLEKQPPVDIYILSDTSFTMRPVIQEIGQTSDTLRKLIKKNAKLVRFGFGAFVEKPLPPFSHINPASACLSNSEDYIECEPPYSYRHVSNFIVNETQFRKILTDLKSSVNMDKPEAGLDALLQAALCPDILGWDPDALKIVVYLSDSGIHIGGDGLLAGITRVPDMQCHMDKMPSGTIEYKDAAKFDYPSIGMVADALEKSDISVIFLVTEKILPLYEQLAKALPSANAAQLPNNTDPKTARIAKILNDNYKSIKKPITLEKAKDDLQSNITVRMFAQCHPNAPWIETSTCEGVSLDGTAKFRIEVSAKRCLDTSGRLKFDSKGQKGTQLDIDVSTLCNCEGCVEVEKDQQCSSAKSVCGVCQCPVDRTGLLCESGKKECRSDDACKDSKGIICGGHGKCSCGKCMCFDGFGGQFCDCRANCKIDVIQNRVCGGPERGRCLCDKTCECFKDFAGDACDCLTTNGKKDCQQKNTKEILNKRLICTSTRIRRCVVCHHDKTPEDAVNAGDACKEECEGIGNALNITLKDTLTTRSICVIENKEHCRILVSYERKGNEQISMLIARSCVGIIRRTLLPLIVGVVAGILLLGLLIVCIWRLVAFLEDRAEYARLLEAEKKWEGEMNVNPLYLSPQTEVVNPIYNKDDNL